MMDNNVGRPKTAFRINIIELDLKKLNLSLSSQLHGYSRIEIRIESSKFIDIEKFDIIVVKETDHIIFNDNYLGNKFLVESAHFIIDNFENQNITIEIVALDLRGNSIYKNIYNLKMGVVDSEILLENITNEGKHNRGIILDWIEEHQDQIHHEYDNIISDLLLLHKIEK
jgi:hypothetical protein